MTHNSEQPIEVRAIIPHPRKPDTHLLDQTGNHPNDGRTTYEDTLRRLTLRVCGMTIGVARRAPEHEGEPTVIAYRTKRVPPTIEPSTGYYWS